MNIILLSVKEKFAELILNNEKIIELRKTRPRDFGDAFDDAYIVYGGKVHGRATVGGYMSIPFALRIMGKEKVLRDACVTEEYAKAYNPYFAWYINGAKRFANPVSLADVGIKRAPQSWQYLTQAQANEIERIGA